MYIMGIVSNNKSGALNPSSFSKMKSSSKQNTQEFQSIPDELGEKNSMLSLKLSDKDEATGDRMS
jgi:hypothetical protein